MSSALNPVQVAIRDHLHARYRPWRRTAATIGTRAGLRYPGRDVALLFRPPLRDAGLLAYDDGNYFRGVFVTRQGRRVSREQLRDLLCPVVEGHEDPALVATVSSEAFFSALGDLLPQHDGPVDFARAPRRRRAPDAGHLAPVEEFLGEVVDTPLPAGSVFEIYGEWADAGEVPHLGRTTFYRVAEATGLVARRRRRDGLYLVPIRRATSAVVRAGRRLSTRAAEVLRTCGLHDPEAYADEAEREILDRATDHRHEILDPRVVGLPWQVAYAIAGAAETDVVQAFGRMAREHLRRHPEDRPAVVAVAVALRAGDPDGLAAQSRARCASAIKAEDLDGSA